MEANNKLREALKELQSRLVAGVYDGSIDCHEALMVVEKALAEPPRQCDVGTADEQVNRHIKWCDSNVCKFTYSCRVCFAKWSQTPYKEGAAK